MTQGTSFSKGQFRVTRWCCTSALCIECRGFGNLSKRKRVVQTYGVSKVWAEHVVAGWNVYGFEPKVEKEGGADV